MNEDSIGSNNDGLMMDRVIVRAPGNKDVVLLNNVSTVFEKGKITLLIGRNGAGKTTLLETIAGLRKMEAGSVLIAGESLMKGSGHRLNAKALLRIGISLQHSESQWFAATVKEELQYSLRPYKLAAAMEEGRIRDAMSQMGLSMELLQQDPWTLSGGQQRRLSLASLLACEPDWLLLDEPTAGLDAVGIRRLCAALQAHRAAGRSVVVATHDHSALWPLADAVAVVDGGEICEAAAPAAASAVAAAGAALRAQELLRAIGAAVPPQAPPMAGGAIALPPHAAAAAIAEEVRQRRAATADFAHVDLAAAACANRVDLTAEAAAERDDLADKATAERDNLADKATAERIDLVNAAAAERTELAKQVSVNAAYTRTNSAKSLAGRYSPDYFDPRALLLSYILLATVILLQEAAVGIAVSAFAAAMVLFPVRQLLKPWIKIAVSYAVFIAVCCFIAGLSLNPFSWDEAQMAVTGLRLGKLLIVMLMGMPMLALMTPFRLQRGLEQSLGWLQAVKIPVYSFTLLMTLIFRFIPMLGQEWGRFAKLAHARGKAASPAGTVPLRMLPIIVIPYIRSLLRLGEQMADALEARGFGIVKEKPIYGFRMRFSGRDRLLLIYVLILTILVMTAGILAA